MVGNTIPSTARAATGEVTSKGSHNNSDSSNSSTTNITSGDSMLPVWITDTTTPSIARTTPAAQLRDQPDQPKEEHMWGERQKSEEWPKPRKLWGIVKSIPRRIYTCYSPP